MEIERKFCVKNLPKNLENYEALNIEQGYLNQIPVVRIRRSNHHFYLTYKSKAGHKMDSLQKASEIALCCEEIELPLTEAAYYHLREKIDFYLIKKKRYLIPLENSLTAELDVFEGRLFGLSFVEVEFPGEEEAKKFELPDWFAREVTFDKQYQNSELAKLEKWG